MQILRSLLIVLLVSLSLLSPAGARAADKKLTVADYLLLLPPGPYFSDSPREILRRVREGQGVLDVANGFIQLDGYNEQPSLQVTFFNSKNDSPLVAVTYGDLGSSTSFTRLAFFERGSGAGLVPVSRSIFPVEDNPRTRFYSLPREGKTITVINNASGADESRYTWTGDRFRKDK